jgi:peptide/nickel transport system ATP-binding protein
MALLAVQDLSLAISGQMILKNLSLSLDAGQVLGIVGESGSGKSMTALSIMQLLPHGSATGGSVKLDGQELLEKSERELCAIRGRDIGMIFQEPMTALNPVRTIGDQVSETVRLHRSASRAEADAIARQTLDRVGLPAGEFPLDRYPHDLSGGQRQRVVIAMAVALKPKLLIADEPTTALDVTTQAQILDLLRELVEEDNAGLMLITHDLAVVAGMADQIAIMKDGEIVEAGETVSLFRTLSHPYSRKLMSASTHVPDRRHRPTRSELNAQPVLSVDGIVRDYRLPRRSLFSAPRTFRAVDNVSFEIHRGENIGLVGESGCGKSTLSRTILALDPPQSGRIILDGEGFSTASGEDLNRLRRRIQVVFQDPYGSFNPRHRVERLVAEPFHLMDEWAHRKARRQKVEDVLEKVGLKASDADKYPHEFSGGQRQRIAIARALITEPALIVLDEAVSALDVSIRAQILDLLADLSDRLHVCYLFISHDLTVVRSITDRVLVMQAGRIVEHGPTEEVFADPQHPYTASLIAATPVLERTLALRETGSINP